MLSASLHKPIETDKMSLLATYIGLNFPALRRNWFSQRQLLFSHRPTTGLSTNTIKYHEYASDHFKNLLNTFLVHSLPILQISRKSTHNVLVTLLTSNKQTNEQTAMKTVPLQKYQS